MRNILWSSVFCFEIAYLCVFMDMSVDLFVQVFLRLLLLLTGSTPVCREPFPDLFGVHSQVWNFCVLFLLVCCRISSSLLPDSGGVGFILYPGSVLCLSGLSRGNNLLPHCVPSLTCIPAWICGVLGCSQL